MQHDDVREDVTVNYDGTTAVLSAERKLRRPPQRGLAWAWVTCSCAYQLIVAFIFTRVAATS